MLKYEVSDPVDHKIWYTIVDQICGPPYWKLFESLATAYLQQLNIIFLTQIGLTLTDFQLFWSPIHLHMIQ